MNFVRINEDTCLIRTVQGRHLAVLIRQLYCICNFHHQEQCFCITHYDTVNIWLSTHHRRTGNNHDNGVEVIKCANTCTPNHYIWKNTAAKLDKIHGLSATRSETCLRISKDTFTMASWDQRRLTDGFQLYMISPISRS